MERNDSCSSTSFQPSETTDDNFMTDENIIDDNENQDITTLLNAQALKPVEETPSPVKSLINRFNRSNAYPFSNSANFHDSDIEKFSKAQIETFGENKNERLISFAETKIEEILSHESNELQSTTMSSLEEKNSIDMEAFAERDLPDRNILERNRVASNPETGGQKTQRMFTFERALTYSFEHPSQAETPEDLVSTANQKGLTKFSRSSINDIRLKLGLEQRSTMLKDAQTEADRLLKLETNRHGDTPTITIKAIAPQRMSQIKQVLREAIPIVAKKRAKQIEKNCAYAKLWILDAFQGRLSNGLANNSKKSWWIYTIFRIQTSEVLFMFVIYGCILHTISIFFEPENACSASIFLKIFQSFVVSLYVFDIALKISYEGIQTYWEKDWQRFYLAVAVLDVLDLCCNSCSLYSNPLRPVPGILRARNGRRFFDIMKKMIPGTYNSMAPIIFFIMIVLVICSIFFDTEVKNLADTSYNWFFIIFTNDSFETLLPNDSNLTVGYLLFFFPAIYIAQKFMLSLIVGDTYETFRKFVKKQIAKERLKEMQGLTKAFSVLDDTKTGIISNIVWRECLAQLRPDIGPEAVALYYELISGGSSHGVSVISFLSLKNVLSFRLTVKSNSTNKFTGFLWSIFQKCKAMYGEFYVAFPSKWFYPSLKLMKAVDKYGVVAKINAIDFLLTLSGRQDIILQSISLHSMQLHVTPCFIINCIYMCEFVVRWIINDGSLAGIHLNNNLASNLFVFGAVGRLAYSFFLMKYAAISDPSAVLLFEIPFLNHFRFTTGKLLILLRGLRSARMMNYNQDLISFNTAIIDVMPVLLETMTFTLVLSYVFGMAGNLLFGQYGIQDWATPTQGFVTVQKLSYMVNFLDVTERVIAIHYAYAIFFLFYLILSLAVSNVALSIIIDMHSNLMDSKSGSKDRDGQKKKIDIVFDQIVSRARTRVIFNKGGKTLNFKNIQMSQFQSMDARHFITNAKDEPFKMEEIKACQKHSNIDLIKFYANEQHRTKDLHWEADFLKKCHDAEVYREKEFHRGDIIYQVCDSAVKFYLLLTGSVILFGGESSKVVFQSTNFIGYECVLPKSYYEYTCMAEGNVTCLEFFIDDLSSKITDEMCGSIVRMMHKSHGIITSAFEKLQIQFQFASSSSTPAKFGNPGTLPSSHAAVNDISPVQTHSPFFKNFSEKETTGGTMSPRAFLLRKSPSKSMPLKHLNSFLLESAMTIPDTPSILTKEEGMNQDLVHTAASFATDNVPVIAEPGTILR